MEQQVITAVLAAQRKQIRQERAYDGYVNHCTKFKGLNRAARRHVGKALQEVMVGGTLLFQSIFSVIDLSALNAWQATDARKQAEKAAARQKAGVQ